MKKALSIVFAVVVLATSCSKEAKLNRKLDGEWSLTKVYGQAPASGYSGAITFDKDKKGKGTYTYTFTTPTGPTTETGSYVLVDDEMIIRTSSAAGSTADTGYVVEYSKKILKISTAKVAVDSTTIEYEKK